LKFLSLLLLISFYSHAKPFKITITGEKEDLPSISKVAELEVAKSTTHCRGPYIPYAKSRWNCSGEECTRVFDCKRITKRYSRMTLIGNTRKSIKKSKKIKGEYEVRWPIDKPPSFETGKAAKKRTVYQKKLNEVKRIDKEVKQLEFVKIKEIERKKKTTLIKDRPTPKILEEEALALLEEENLEAYDDVLAQKPSKMYQDVNIDDLVPSQKEKFKTEITENDAKWKLVTKTAEDGSEKNYALKKVEKGPPTFKPRIKWANFSFSYKSISDDQEEIVGTGNASWSPQWIFNPHWAIKVDAGVQFYTISVIDQIGTTLETTTFPVIPLMGYINYLSDIYFLEAGLGMQFWWEDRLDNYFAWSVGFGYRFPVTVNIFDRIFFNYNNVATNTGIQEFQLGFAIRI